MSPAEALARQHFPLTTLDRGNRPMIDHMERVAALVEPAYKDAAWLHDIVEDTSVSLTQLIQLGFPEVTVVAVDLLTHDKKTHTYAEYIDRLVASNNRCALHVKLADQTDNLDPRRQLGMNRWVTKALSKKYAGVYDRLMEAALKCEF